MNDQPWYGAKCIFLHTDIESCPGQVYEERVILVKAESLDAAISRAERMAEEYAEQLSGCLYIGFVDVFHIYDEHIGEGTEVYSLMRASNLNRDDYLNRFYETGTERTQK
ncbi:MAG TPA: DUF4288 domain-containing protein [Pyrinomonadaceae bacterium]|nr:DUF4288 domain-containing protein [Pyrinomonadaceae bacterium]